MSDTFTPIRKLKVEYRSTGSLIPYANNARTHSKAQIKQIARSLQAFDWTNPLLIDEAGNVVCGHGRLEAAKLLGMTMVPVIVLENMSEDDRRAYVLADNQLAQRSGWSKAILRAELQGLIEIGYNVEVVGFDTIEIDTLLSVGADDEVGQADDIVPMPSAEPPVSRVGDLWTCGKHRLIVGDACEPTVIEKLMDGKRAQLVFTDPPYGCDIMGFASTHHENFGRGSGIALPELAMAILRPAFRNIAAYCDPGAIAFVCTDHRAAPHMLDAAKGVFEQIKNWIIWAKTNAGMGTFYRSQFEIILAFQVSKGKVINNFGLGEGGRHRSNLWTYPGANTFRKGRMQDLHEHPTVKPKKLVADAILDCSRPAGIILDVFAGSGTTLVAAQMTSRIGYGVELDPKYADVIINRLSAEVGQSAFLDGVPFADVAASRRSAESGRA